MASTIGPATRSEGLRRLNDFLPRAGRGYAEQRNYDFGPEERSNVSLLSPWIRHRLITEEEVLAAVLGQHSPAAASKFIQEVCWRSYWKGWLELRPAVWTDYRDEVDDWLARLSLDPELRSQVEAAREGATGIDCFDHWARELVEQGYLHNHARMWFASIWVFTLKLPWALGADFFLRYLLDGDPASNTLSWRWVAGLQTRGKHYLARANNIERFTAGRFRHVTGLAEDAAPLEAPALPAPRGLPGARAFDHRAPTALLLTEEDLSAAEFIDAPIRAVGGFVHTAGRSPLPVGPIPQAFATQAVEDAVSSAGATLGAPTRVFPRLPTATDLRVWAEDAGCTQLLLPYPPVGPIQEWADSVEAGLQAAPLHFATVRRSWDSRLWPLATKGFFNFNRQVTPLLADLLTAPSRP